MFDGTVDSGVIDALCDDLNTPAALVRLHELAKAGDAAALCASLGFLGFSCDPPKLVRKVFLSPSQRRPWFQPELSRRSACFESGGNALRTRQSEARFDELIALRKAARAAKNLRKSDRIRDELASIGVAIKDNKDGTTTWEVKR